MTPLRYPRPAVLDHIPRPFAVVEASAGTGKTFTLEHLVVDRVLEGMPLDQILVVTFTDKAAQELRTRIRVLLERMCAGAVAPEVPVGSGFWTLDDTARERLRQARAALERCTFATIHSFCQRVLQDSALERRSLLDPTQADAHQLFDRAFGECLRGPAVQDPGLRDLLAQALGDGWSPEKIGKLLWEAHREGCRILPDLAAVEARRQRFPGSLDAEAIIQGWRDAKVHAGTLKAAAERLGAFLQLLSKAPYPFAAGLKELNMDTLVTASSKPGLRGDAQRFGAWLLAFTAPTPEAVVAAAFLPLVQARLREIKAQEGFYDFDDMILLVREALVGPAGETLAARLRARFRLALVDECQDTDGAQWDIFRTLFHREGHELVLVGDPKQAIYGFRGGDLPSYLAARELLAGNQVVSLAENFRSTKPLLQVCEALCGQPEFFTGAVAFVTVDCGKPDLGLEDGDGHPLPPLRVVPVLETSGGLRLWRRVAQGLAGELAALLRSGARFGPAGKRVPLGPKDVFVLVGKRSEGELMAQALGEAGLPFAFYKQKGLFERPEAQAWLQVLEVLEEPQDPGRLARALLSPFFGFQPVDLEGLGELGDGHPVRQRLRKWGELARRRRFAELLETILTDSAVAERLLLQDDGDQALTNLRHLAELLTRVAREDPGDLSHLVHHLRRWRAGLDFPPGENGDQQRLEGRERAVQILTLHAAKGLEAPVVAIFAPGKPMAPILHRFHDATGTRCAWLGSLPKGSDWATRAQAEVEEERERLAYVALTRAQARLVLPCFLGDKGSKPFHTEGPHQVVNRVLRPLVLGGRLPGAEIVQTEAGPGIALPDPLPEAAPLRAPSLDADGLRSAARPRRTTSFTALQRRLDWARSEGRDDPEPDAPGAAADGLPRGRVIGTLLHELLETVELQGVRGRDFEAWWASPTLREPILRRAALAGLGPEAAREAALRVFLGCTTPLPLGDHAAALAEADHSLRELEFLTGMPDSQDFLGGSLDGLFEHQGHSFVLDWKSNGLPDYGPEALAACVADHYELQVRIYTLAALRFLGLTTEAAYETRFGGVLYVFLRGLPEAGVWSYRPSWTEVQGWEQELAQLGAEVVRG